MLRRSCLLFVLLSSLSMTSAAAAGGSCAALRGGGDVTTARLALADGRSIPRVGLGVYQSTPGAETYNAVKAALEFGYRHIDTAHLYQNENDVGRAVRDFLNEHADTGVSRSDIFITTKLWASMSGEPDDGFQHAIQSGLDSQRRLGTYIDLYLIHSPGWVNERLNAWRGMEELVSRGVAKSIGVSNYGVRHLEELVDAANIAPVVNQIELHPFLRHEDIVAFCQARDILLEAYSPLAKARRFGDVPRRPRVVVGEDCGEEDEGNAQDGEEGAPPTAAQVMLRWGLEKGFVVLPKSVNPKRIRENAELFSWQLSKTAMLELDQLGEGFSTGWDPTTWD